jgi:Ran GTPase-activating protein (RanGAP) involved in mRNA processing and transport
MLRVNDTLLELNLAKHGLRDFGAVELCVGLVANKSLRYLDLRCNKLSVECCAALNDLLTKTSSITSLILSHNALGDAGALVLASGLRSNRTLQNLDMSHCKIKGGGLIALADGIRHQGMLEQLQLWGNEFSVDAAEVLCEKMLPRLQYVPDFACPHREQISLVMWFPDSRPRSFAARIRLESSQPGAFISQDVCDACAQQRARAMRPCYALAGI